MAKTRFRVLVGLNYPPDDRRAEPGEIVDDIPDFAEHKLEQAGVIERVKKGDTDAIPSRQAD